MGSGAQRTSSPEQNRLRTIELLNRSFNSSRLRCCRRRRRSSKRNDTKLHRAIKYHKTAAANFSSLHSFAESQRPHTYSRVSCSYQRPNTALICRVILFVSDFVSLSDVTGTDLVSEQCQDWISHFMITEGALLQSIKQWLNDSHSALMRQ